MAKAAPASRSATERLKARIAREGAITVAELMAEALIHPERGYYSSHDPFGAAGDFVTAPEISQMFGELIGLWCAEVWRLMGEPATLGLIELGPGRGTLLADALRAARLVPEFRAALTLHLVEASPRLIDTQRARLAAPGDAPSATWHADLGRVPEGRFILIANEFFDALPVRQFENSANGWRERLVTLDPETGALTFALSPPSPLAGRAVPAALAQAPAGTVFEASPAASSLANTIGRRAAVHGGAALIVDYGYETPPGRPTLQALRAHARHEVLDEPGSADLTAHVDFAALAAAAMAAGARVQGPTPQGAFLEALGLAQRAEGLKRSANPSQAEAIETAQRRLADPEAMGMLFKAVAIADPALPPLPGFAV
ncbi:MAG: class I SAM-dependent methyltransferase [Kiloniellales bacterium]